MAMLQVGAALLVPLAALASQTVSDANAATWCQLVVIGFASDTIKSILVGRQDQAANTGLPAGDDAPDQHPSRHAMPGPFNCGCTRL